MFQLLAESGKSWFKKDDGLGGKKRTAPERSVALRPTGRFEFILKSQDLKPKPERLDLDNK